MGRRIDVPKDLREFARVFAKAGFSCYFVGGAVRDSLLGLPVSDWDAATDAKPEQVRSLFRSVIPTGIQHGTVTVRWQGRSIETTTFRVDGEYKDGRRPESVRFTSDLLEDLSRRDFTINGMAVDPDSGVIIAPDGGLRDLADCVIRAIGDPVARFEEDGLRPLRAIRFASRLGFSIDEATFAAIPATVERFRKVSAERVREELAKILASARAGEGLLRLDESGLLPEILPELSRCKGVGQGGPHRYDVFRHLVAACDAAPQRLTLRLAALLHDIGKPARRAEADDGSLTFYGHDVESARLAEAALRRLKFPNALVDEVVHLVRHHMFDYSEHWTDAAVRRFVSRVGLESVKPLAELRLADTSGMGNGPADVRSVMPLIARVEALRAKDQAFSLKDLAIGGNDLAGIGWPKGPSMGRALAEMLEAVLDDPDLNTRERLLEIAERIKVKHGVI
ncbi:MAG: CCA tRNA nucleotidyltransferase [Spirochaetes bacterium]|nr:CCA tRNA nucleotidyltransferase [Spirochaetota bacterium]MBU1079593.1 CCA tRNA nucleotidyltransferase [Spirochaetota bacterium]